MKALTHEQVINVLKDYVSTMSTQKAAAYTLGVSSVYLHLMLIGRRRICGGVLAKLGYKEVVLYESTKSGTPGDRP